MAANAELYFEGAPELAVEVISPSDTARDIETKVRQYLAFGANEVWVLYLKTRTVHVFQADSKATILDGWQTLEGSPTLPRLRIKVEQLFAL